MNRILITIFTLIFLTSCIGAGEISDISDNNNDYFPSMIGIDLNGKKRKVPESFKGKYNIVAIAFEREHQKDINSWINVADKILETNNNISFYEIPLIYKINTPYRFWINNGMRAGIQDPTARNRTITIYTDRKEFTSIMDMKTDRIYIQLQNNNGKILWQTEGPANKNKINGLMEAIKQSTYLE